MKPCKHFALIKSQLYNKKNKKSYKNPTYTLLNVIITNHFFHSYACLLTFISVLQLFYQFFFCVCFKRI